MVSVVEPPFDFAQDDNPCACRSIIRNKSGFYFRNMSDTLCRAGDLDTDIQVGLV